MKGQLSMGINQHSNVNLQGFELLGFEIFFFVPPENLPLPHKNILLTNNCFPTCCDQEVGVFPPLIITTKKLSCE